jgi:hypothetical protein
MELLTERLTWILYSTFKTVHFGQSYWVSGLCPSSGILNTGNTTFLKLDQFPSSDEGRKIPTLLGPLETTNLKWLRLALSKGPKRVGVSFLTWGRKQVQFPKHSVYQYLESRTMDKVQKPSNSVLYTIVRNLQILRILLYQILDRNLIFGMLGCRVCDRFFWMREEPQGWPSTHLFI